MYKRTQHSSSDQRQDSLIEANSFGSQAWIGPVVKQVVSLQMLFSSVLQIWLSFVLSWNRWVCCAACCSSSAYNTYTWKQALPKASDLRLYTAGRYLRSLLHHCSSSIHKLFRSPFLYSFRRESGYRRQVIGLHGKLRLWPYVVV